MARVNYTGIVDNITGRLNNNVFQRNGSGYVVRSVGVVRNQSTPLQQQQHNNLYMFLGLYSGLSFNNKLLWKVFADTYTKVNNYGRTMYLSGQNWYVHINANRYLIGLPLLEVPPVYSVAPGGNSFRTDCGENGYRVYHNNGAVGANIFLKVENTTLLKSGTSTANRFLRYCSVVPLIYREEYNLTADYELLHSIDLSSTAGKDGTICITRLSLIDSASGIASPAVNYSAAYTQI